MPMTGSRLPKRGIFMIVFAARSGSTFLISILNQHDNIMCYPEVLQKKSPDQQKAFLEGMVRGEKVEKLNGRRRIWRTCRNRAPVFPLYELKALFHTPDWIGLKTQLGQISDRAQFRAIAEDNEFRIIQLSRRNPVATAVSALNAQRLKEKFSHHNAKQATERLGALHIDKDEFDQMLRKREAAKERMSRYVSSINAPIHRCYYEDLLEDREQFLTGIFEFLDVPMEPVDYKDIIFKNTPKSLDQAILNYDEIRDAYTATAYEKYFAE